MSFSLNVKKGDVWPPLPTVTDKAKEYTNKVDYITSAAILNGFDWDYPINDTETKKYHFSYKSDDQQNFSTQNEMALLIADNTISQLQGQLATTTKQLAEALKQLTQSAANASTLEEEAEGTVGCTTEDTVRTPMLDPNTTQTVDTFMTAWQGHDLETGDAVTLQFNFSQFIQFTIAAGMHKQNTISRGWEWKRRFRECKTEDEMKSYATEIKLDQEIITAREIYEKLGIKTEVTY